MATSNLKFRIIGEDDASGAFLKVAAASKLLNSTFSDLGTNALGISKLIGGAGLIPVMAGAAAATTELTVSLGAAAGAAGIFGISAVGIVADMLKQQKAITATDAALSKLTPGTAEYAAKLKELHAQQSAFDKEFGKAGPAFDKMKTSFSSFKQATAGVTTDVLAKGFGLLSSILPKLVPVSNAAGKAIGGLLDDLQNWTKGPAFKGLLHWFETSGPKAITHFGHAVGNIFTGLGGILSNFVKPGDKAAASLERLTARFADWGRSKGVSDSVNKFLNYVSDNGPNITATLSSLADAAPKLASALGQLGAANLNVVTKSLGLIAALPQGAFDVVVNGLFGIAVASKAVSIAMGIQALITGVATAVTLLGDACIGTRIGLYALAVSEAVAAAPFTAIAIGIGLLVAGLILAYNKVGWFHAAVDGAFHGIAAVVGATVGFIKAHWAVLFAVLGGPIGLVTVLIIKNFGRIQDAIHALGAVAQWLWNNAFQPAFRFIMAGVSAMLDVWGHMLSALGHVPGFGWAKDAGNALQAAADKARGLAENINRIPKHTSISVVTTFTTHGVTHGTGGHTTPDLPGGISGSSGGGLTAGRGGDFGRTGVDAGIALLGGIVKGINSGFVPLKTALGKVTDYIKTQGGKLKSLISDRNSFASGFQSFTTSLFGADYGTNAAGNAVKPDVAGILAYQQKQAKHAARLRANVRKLVHLGLSPALLKQLQAGGQAGEAQIFALAHATPAQIKALNSAQHATASSLNAAGMSAGNAIYGRQIVATKNNIDLAKRIAKELRADGGDHGKGEYVVVTVNGNEIIRAVRKDKRTKGHKSAI